MKQCQRAIVRSITDKQTASAKCPGGKKIGLVLPGGQPLYTDKKNIGDKKKVEIGGDRFFTQRFHNVFYDHDYGVGATRCRCPVPHQI